MKYQKNIDLPTQIDEFYVDCAGNPDDYSYNKEAIENIFKRIR